MICIFEDGRYQCVKPATHERWRGRLFLGQFCDQHRASGPGVEDKPLPKSAAGWLYETSTGLCRGVASYEQLEEFERTGRVMFATAGMKATPHEVRAESPLASATRSGGG